jgi:hypothetical protein
MALISRLAVALGLASIVSFAAGTWSGALVDSKCYAAEQTNTRSTSPYAGQDLAYEIRYCSPNIHATSFAIVQQDGRSLPLDAVGNAKAAELVQTHGSKSPLRVNATGQMVGHIVKVQTLSLAR